MFDEKLLYFYKSALGMWHLAIKRFWIRLLALVLVLLSMVTFQEVWFLNNEYGVLYFILFSLIFVLAAIYLIINPTKKYIKEKYDCDHPSPDWDMFLCAALKKYLFKDVSKKESEEEALAFLISRLTRRLDNKSKTSFLTLVSNSLTLTLAFFIPVWSAFNTWWFKDKNNITVVFHYMMNIPIILVGAFLIFQLLKAYFGKPFFSDIFKGEIPKLTSLIEKLEIIQFSIKHPGYYKEIDHYLNKKRKEIDLIIKEFDERYKNYAPDPLERFRRNVKQKLKNKKSNSHLNQ